MRSSSHRKGVEGNGEIGGHHHAKMDHVDFEDLSERHEQRRGEEHGGQRLDENGEQEVGGIDQQQEHPWLAGHAFDPFSQLNGYLLRGHHLVEAPRRTDAQHDHLFFWENRIPSLEWLTSPRELYAPTLQFICIFPKDDELEISTFLHR